jgi:ABC-type Na+ efflux pump permease subunit
VLLIPALLASIALVVLSPLSIFSEEVAAVLSRLDAINEVGLFLLYVIGINLALYLVVSLVTMALAANSIRREKQGKTWDTLLLTGVNARQIVWGKWWATVCAMGWDHAVMGVIRLGPVICIGLLIRLDFSPALRTSLQPPLTQAAYVALTIGLLATYTGLDALLSAALGIVAALARLEGLIAFMLALGARVAAAAAFLIFIIPPLIAMQNGLVTAVDSLLPALAGLPVGAALVWIALRLGQWLAVRQHATPPR